MWSRSEDLEAWTGVESFELVVQKIEEMASKKKQDDKNLKLLRELVSLPCNKHCFDCQQRGPTYVNMTIGSFVCTSCSGLLRGLTPPNRVKSISMASFTDEEIVMLKSRGNEYCRRVWLGLYDPAHITDVSDETHVKDFMINKYERKRFYLDPSKVTLPLSSQPKPPVAQAPVPHTPQPLALPRTTAGLSASSNNNHHQADPFAPISSIPAPIAAPSTQQDNFANFDNNPIFNAAVSSTPTKQTFFSSASQDLEFLTSAFATPTQAAFTPNQNFSWFNPWSSLPTSTTNTPMQLNNSSNTPAQDRYAALKDLDYLMRGAYEPAAAKPAETFPSATAATSPWGMNGSTSNVFDSPQNHLGKNSGSMFLSPESNSSSSPGNPFVASPAANNNPWGSATPPSFHQPAAAAVAFNRTNPFDTPPTSNGALANHQVAADNGWAANFQDSSSFGSSPFSQGSNFGAPQENNNKGWNFVGNNFNNPFTLGGGEATKSSNPFL